MFWKEVEKERGGLENVNVRIKREDGICVNGEEKLKKIWKSPFEHLMKEKTEREVIVLSMDNEASGVCRKEYIEIKSRKQ